MNNSPSSLQVLGVVYGLLWCGSLAHLGPLMPLQMIRAAVFSFRVKGGLVMELCFRTCLNDGLGSFVGWPIFIFSPSPLGST